MSFRPRITFSEEQAQLLDVAGKFVRDKFPLEKVRATLGGGAGGAAGAPFDKKMWNEIHALGWATLTIDEADGGAGLGLGDACAVLEPMGRNLFASPLAGNIVAALLAKRAGARDFLKEMTAGTSQVAVALSEPHGAWSLSKVETRNAGGKLRGTKTLISHADSADQILVLAQSAADQFDVVALDGAQVAPLLEAEKVIDETQRCFRLKLDGVVGRVLGTIDGAALSEIERTMQLLLASLMCGAQAGVLDVVVEYLKTRKQFGKFIGAYQSLKHPTVDILIGLEASRSHLYYAAGLAPSDEAQVAAHMVSAQASDALTFAADRAVQFMGAFGFTYDCDAQLFLRRALFSEYQMGDSAYHRQKIADLSF